MQHLARASGVPLSLPNSPERAYIERVRAFHCPSLPPLGCFQHRGDLFSKGAPRPGCAFVIWSPD